MTTLASSVSDECHVVMTLVIIYDRKKFHIFDVDRVRPQDDGDRSGRGRGRDSPGPHQHGRHPRGRRGVAPERR